MKRNKERSVDNNLGKGDYNRRDFKKAFDDLRSEASSVEEPDLDEINTEIAKTRREYSF